MANWYAYNGSGFPTLAASYRLMTIKPACEGGSIRICAIYLDQTSAVPSAIDANVLNYIADAQGTQESQPQGAVKRFAYVKVS